MWLRQASIFTPSKLAPFFTHFPLENFFFHNGLWGTDYLTWRPKINQIRWKMWLQQTSPFLPLFPSTKKYLDEIWLLRQGICVPILARIAWKVWELTSIRTDRPTSYENYRTVLRTVERFYVNLGWNALVFEPPNPMLCIYKFMCNIEHRNRLKMVRRFLSTAGSQDSSITTQLFKSGQASTFQLSITTTCFFILLDLYLFNYLFNGSNDSWIFIYLGLNKYLP